MTINNAIAELPVYSETEIPEPEVLPRSHRREMEVERLKKRYGLAVAALFVWGLSMILGCCITGVLVHKSAAKKTRAVVLEEINQGFLDYENAPGTITRELTQLKNAGFEDFLDWQIEQARKATFKTGDASLQSAIDEMVEPVAVHVAGLRLDRGVTVDGVKTYIWGVDFSRLMSNRYGATIQDVLAGNIEGYTEGRGVRDEDRVIARELCSDYINGNLPDKWTQDLEFAEINADGSVTARSKLKTDSTTKFWRWGE